jgi:hypothetical protein
MSGPEFERYMASVFEALGYKATVLGGAGDQGVDLLLQKENELIAVQCKNYRQTVGNTPIQEIYAGAKHHTAHHAWVIAPAGFTKWAVELARSTGVELYARAHIEKWVEQARIQQRIDSLQKAMDREDYKTLLTLYSETLDNLEYRYDVEHHYAAEITYNASIREQYEQTRRSLYRYISDFSQDLDTLERRNPEFATDDELVVTRKALKERQQEIDRAAEQSGISNKPAYAPTPPQTLTKPSSSRMSGSAHHDLVLGDTVISPAGDRLVIHSYEFGYDPEKGYEFLAIDVEACSSENPERQLSTINPYYFVLQLADNTRAKPEISKKNLKKPLLEVVDLFPGDCARGWVTFPMPEGKQLKFVVFKLSPWMTRWAIPPR